MKKTEKNYYQSLYEVASLLNSEHEPWALLHSFVESVGKATGAKACSLMLLTPGKEVLLHTVAYGLSDWYLRRGPVKIGRVLADVLRGKPVVVYDATQDERVLYREALPFHSGRHLFCGNGRQPGRHRTGKCSGL